MKDSEYSPLRDINGYEHEVSSCCSYRYFFQRARVSTRGANLCTQNVTRKEVVTTFGACNVGHSRNTQVLKVRAPIAKTACCAASNAVKSHQESSQSTSSAAGAEPDYNGYTAHRCTARRFEVQDFFSGCKAAVLKQVEGVG